jgi:hypothetical protein
MNFEVMFIDFLQWFLSHMYISNLNMYLYAKTI